MKTVYESINLNPLAGLVAGEDLTSYKFRFVRQNAPGLGIVSVTANNQIALGVQQNRPEEGQAVEVVADGNVSKVVCGAALDAGVEVTSDANGRAVPAAGDNQVHGVTMTKTNNVGELVSVLIQARGNFS